MSTKRLRNSTSYRTSQRLFLKEEITFKTADKAKINSELVKLTNDIRTVISFVDWTHIFNTVVTSNDKAIKKVESIQNYKLSELIGEQMTHDPNDVIRNYSSYDLSEMEKSLLVKGLNFALPPKKLIF